MPSTPWRVGEVMALRVGVVGFGAMGRQHVRVLGTLDGVEFVGAVDPAWEALGGLPEEQRLATIDELIARRLDYCVISVPAFLHEEVGTRMASAGVPSLIEKPLAMDAPSAERLATAFEKAGVLGAVGHVERYNAAVRSARERIQQGDLGEVFQVSTRRQGPFPSRISDVGVVKDLATHDIDLTSWVADSGYRSVSAVVTHRSGRATEDGVLVAGTLERGTIVSHAVNWLAPFKERETTVIGERGAFVIDTLAADLTFYSSGHRESAWEELAHFRGVREGDVTRIALDKPEPLLMEHIAFRDAVLGQPSVIVSLSEGVEVMRVADAVIAAAQSGHAIDVGDIG